MVKVIYNIQDRDAMFTNVKVILLKEYKEKADYYFIELPEYENVFNIIPDEHGDYGGVFEVAENCEIFQSYTLDILERPVYKQYKKLSEFIEVYETSDLDLLVVIE